jgi:hypothetical protein
MNPTPHLPPHGPDRRYSDEEVQQLLERAAELEAEHRSSRTPRDGPTLRDLEGIAAEAGIDPALLRRAAEELEGSPAAALAPLARGTPSRFLGAPATVEYVRTVPVEATGPILESLIPLIRHATDGRGQCTVAGRTLTWVSTPPWAATWAPPSSYGGAVNAMETLQGSISVRRGSTRIVIQERLGPLAGGIFGGLMGGLGCGVGFGVGFGVGLGALGSVLFASVFPPAILGGSYLAARAIYGSHVRDRHVALTRLMDDLVATVEDGVG